MRNLFSITFLLSILSACSSTQEQSTIRVSGKMSDVMWRGKLNGIISTDSLKTKTAYGLGPVEYLKGEILLFEGKTFVSKVIDSASHNTEEVSKEKAPFFVYSIDNDLKSVAIDSELNTLQEIESYINTAYQSYDLPLLIRIDGLFDQVELHSVNLPTGSEVSSPKEAHQGLTKYKYPNIKGSLIGFFSRNHKSIFTHHDTYFHAHFISENRQILGHVDDLNLRSDMIDLWVSK